MTDHDNELAELRSALADYREIAAHGVEAVRELILTQAISEAVAAERAMHVSNVARAVGLLEGLGAPDPYLTRQLQHLAGDKIDDQK